jgi:hypothetical protein
MNASVRNPEDLTAQEISLREGEFQYAQNHRSVFITVYEGLVTTSWSEHCPTKKDVDEDREIWK